MCNVHIETNFSHVQIAGLLKKPWRRGSANSPGSLLVSSPLPPWRGATPREPSSRPRQGVGGAPRGSQGPVSDQLYSSVWQERKTRRRRQNILLISTCNFFSCCIVRLEIYSCGAKVFDSPSIAVALWCCLWVAVKQFCSSLYISSTSFWNGDDEFFLTSQYNVHCTYIGFLSQQSWH